MVGAINAPTSGPNTFAAFQAAAKNSTGDPGVRPMSFLIYIRPHFYSFHF